MFTGGLEHEAPVFSVDASSGTPCSPTARYVESKEHLGGFAVVDVDDEEAARLWAGKDRGGVRVAAGGTPLPVVRDASRGLSAASPRTSYQACVIGLEP